MFNSQEALMTAYNNHMEEARIAFYETGAYYDSCSEQWDERAHAAFEDVNMISLTGEGL